MTGAIRFRQPRLRRMRNGNLALELTEAGSWESFAAFAEQWAAQVGATVEERLDGPDVRVWRLSYQGHALRLVYDDFPNGITVEPEVEASNAAVEKLFATVSSEAAPDGA